MADIEHPIVYRKLSELKLWEDNPRRITKDELDRLKRSLERDPDFMEAMPIVCSDRTGELVIISGNQRYKGVKALGWKEVPTVVYHCQTEEEEVRKAMIANHNNGEWDTEMLANKFSDYPLDEWLGSDWDAIMGNFEETEIDKLREVEPEEPPEEPKSKPGEIYKLGIHRLMVGDSTKQDQVEKLMDGQLADLVVTDPPYNVDYEGHSKYLERSGRPIASTGKIMNDYMDEDKFLEFLIDANKTAKEFLKDGGAFYIWHSDAHGLTFRRAAQEAGLRVRQCLIWNKSSITIGRSDYQWKHEPCLYGWKDGAGHYFTDDRTQATVIDEQPNLEEMTKSELVTLLEKFYELPTTVIDCQKPHRSDEHPTMKPVKLIGRLVKNSSRERERVLDLFGGSGTTMIACEQLNRQCYMMELDPHYADVIIDRWEKLTGQKAEKIA